MAPVRQIPLTASLTANTDAQQLFDIIQAEDARLNFTLKPPQDVSDWLSMKFTARSTSGIALSYVPVLVDGSVGMWYVDLRNGNTVSLVPTSRYLWDFRLTNYGQDTALALGSMNVLAGATLDVLETLAFLVQPQAANTGAVLATVNVEVLNPATGLPDPADNSTVVTLALTVPGSAILGGTLVRTVVAGVATFNDLTVDTGGTYTFSATSPSAAPATSNGFVVTPVVAPSGLQARYPLDDGSGITVRDLSGNNYTGTFGAALGAPYYPTWTSQGVSFNGAQTIGIPTAALTNAGTVMVFCTPTLSNQSRELTCVYGHGGNTLALGFAPGDGRPGGFTTTSGDPGYASATPIISGTLGVTWRQDGTIWLNGTQVPYYQVPQASQVPPTPYTGLSDCYLGSWFSVIAGFNGSMYYAVIWNRQLTAAEIKATHQAITTTLIGRGLTLSYNTALTHALLAFDGDSITRGYIDNFGQGYGIKTLGLLSGTYNFVNMAVGGQSAGDILARAPSSLDKVRVGFSGTSILTVMIGTNGAWSNTELTNFLAYCTARYAAGWGKIIAVTSLPATRDTVGSEAARQTWNTYLRNNVSPGVTWDAVADWGNDPNMGQAGQDTNVTYFADGLHPTTQGHLVGAGYVKNAINSLGLP